ncbi:MAG: phosphoglycerate dehydrogenase [Ignavibacteriales bacterium UTCHB2]|jgi:D-3-phosphoglycerate dehydrogenase|nr:MAG: D-3-phosphoglycerate dehydrogenase [Ignavibacteria bacterium ADurb.Bin266]OQY69670.1 MAG: phosphoglycerate dehydrogenase [Ignavibacteriales bacterium UTCHB2]HQI41648.1 NAD(P)-dependent oxidoreductase [Ignavibacteriaceae bacterium]HQJ45349.1 NAD(P)-dependent oxidoreductase [Ignavibacteriaceae bacterium]
MKNKVLVADKFPEKYIQQMKDLGLDVIYEPKLGEKDLPEAAKEVEILVVRSTVVNEEAINNSKKLNLIIRAGSGVNNINIAAANKKGIYVANCPGMNSIAVAELAVGLIIAIDRRIADNVSDFRNGKWNKAEYSKADGLFGKTLGIVGAGQIGVEVINRVKSFGLNIIAWSRSLTNEKAELLGVERCQTLEEVFTKADIISVHLAQTADTKKLISKDLINKMKKGAYFINTSRAGVVDEDALIEAAKAEKIFLGLDVFNNEPEGKGGDFTTPLQGLKNVYLTHHIGASTEQAQDAVADETVKIINEFVNSGVIRNWVNRIKKSPAKYQLIVKHFDKPGVLAGVLELLKTGNINVEEIENVIFDGAIAASCTMKLKDAATPDMLKKMNENPDLISVSQVEI